MTNFHEALQSVRRRMGPTVKEHEILRLGAIIGKSNDDIAIGKARKEVLAWVAKRAGGKLPGEAWDFADYELLVGGRSSSAVRLRAGPADIWAVRAEDPDKNVPGRSWVHEIVLAQQEGQLPRLSVRQLVNTAEDTLQIQPHVPGFVHQLVDTISLHNGRRLYTSEPDIFQDEDDAEELAARLASKDRRSVVVAVSETDTAGMYLLDPEALQRALLGIGQVAVLSQAATWALTERFGKVRSGFGGAARAYMPGFNENADPYAHRLIVAERMGDADGAERAGRWLRGIAAEESLRQTRLGKDILSFAAIRHAALQQRQEGLEKEGATETDQLVAARERIAALEVELKEALATLDYFDEEHSAAQERAEAAEQQYRAATFRIRTLEELSPDTSEAARADQLPDSWPDLIQWADTELAGKLSLTPRARRMVKEPEFEDARMAATCLAWLANEARQSLIGKSDLLLSDAPVADGVKNAHCGGDEFDLQWQGRRFTADWHVKNGGNTRDPKRCLRIYWFWDDNTQQVVLADMPAHRRTAIS